MSPYLPTGRHSTGHHTNDRIQNGLYSGWIRFPGSHSSQERFPADRSGIHPPRLLSGIRASKWFPPKFKYHRLAVQHGPWKPVDTTTGSKKQIRNNFQQKRGQKQIFHLKIKAGKKPEFPFLLPYPKVNCEKTLSSCLKTVYHFF